MNSKFLTLLFVMGAYAAYGQIRVGTDIPNNDSAQLMRVLIPKILLSGITDITTNSLLTFNTATSSNITPGYKNDIHYSQLQENNRNLERSQKVSQQIIIILTLFSVICGILLLLLLYAYKKIRNDCKKKAILYEIINKKNTSLSEADVMKSNLVSILAHDFRSPLISTRYMVRLMERNTELTESEKESFYVTINDDISGTLENFDATLQWIKHQFGGFKVNFETIDVRSLLDEAICGYTTLLNEKGITVINNVPYGILANSDKEMLQFVNRNLLSNALKFSPKGKTIAVDAFKTEKEIIISVKDEGPGLSDNQMKKLFSISNKRGSTHAGAGIALSFSKDFIIKLGGRIWAENRNTGGTIFSYGVPS